MAPPYVRQHDMRLLWFSLAALFLATSGCKDSTGKEAESHMKHSESSLSSWPRPHFQPGGSDALLFYVVFGKVDRTAALSRSAYRSEGIPDGLSLMTYGPSVHPETVGSFRDGYLWDQLKKADPELAANISSHDTCIVLRGTFHDPKALDYLRDTVGLITFFLDHGGIAVYDPQMFQWWSPQKWRERIFDPAGPVPRHHTVILVSEDTPGTEWIHTRGLRKFGRPDISAHRVPPSLKEGVLDLCNRFIELQAFGGVVAEGQEIRMNSLPPGMRCRRGGELDDPDFNNVHLEIGPDSIGEQGGAAHRSQPVGLGTNCASAAAAPGR
jgi:hypothetical protein